MSVEDQMLGVTRYVMPAAPSVGVRHQDVAFSPFCLPLVVPAALAQTDSCRKSQMKVTRRPAGETCWWSR